MTTQIEEIHQGDSLQVIVAVTDGADSPQPIDLTGAEVDARIRIGETVLDADSATVTDASGGMVTVFFGAGGIDQKGQWFLQVRVTLGSTVDTVVDAIVPVSESNW